MIEEVNTQVNTLFGDCREYLEYIFVPIFSFSWMHVWASFHHKPTKRFHLHPIMACTHPVVHTYHNLTLGLLMLGPAPSSMSYALQDHAPLFCFLLFVFLFISFVFTHFSTLVFVPFLVNKHFNTFFTFLF